LKEKFWNIPNSISLYRVLIFPFILYLIITEKQQLFSVFIAINLVSDLVDGIIARRFNMQTKIGARLDSWADTGTYICAFLAIYLFKWDEIKPHSFILLIFFVIWILSYAVVFIKFKGLIGMHTYLSKITGYLQGSFILVLFLFGFYAWLFYLSISVGIIACLEEIIIIILLKTPMINVKGLFRVLKNRDH